MKAWIPIALIMVATNIAAIPASATPDACEIDVEGGFCYFQCYGAPSAAPFGVQVTAAGAGDVWGEATCGAVTVDCIGRTHCESLYPDALLDGVGVCRMYEGDDGYCSQSAD